MPADAATLTVLGNAYMVDRKPDLALQQFEKAAALDPDNPTIKTRVAISEIDSGQGQQGLATLEQVFSTEAGATVAGPTLVLTELRAGRPDKAAEVASSLIKRDARTRSITPCSGWSASLSGIIRRRRAHSALRWRSIPNSPRQPAIWRSSIWRPAASRRPRKLYSDLLAKKPDDIERSSRPRRPYIAEKKWTEATDAINRARTAARNDPAPGLKLVSLYEVRQDWKSAKTVAAELAAQFPRCQRSRSARTSPNRSRRHQRRGLDLQAGSTSWRLIRLRSCPAISACSAARSILPRPAACCRKLSPAIPERSFESGPDPGRRRDKWGGCSRSQGARLGQGGSGQQHLRPGVGRALRKSGARRRCGCGPEKAVAAKPSDDGLIIALSRTYGRTGDFSKAEAVLPAGSRPTRRTSR